MSDIPAVRVEDLTITYLDTPVVWDVDFAIKSGKLTAIVGPNGAGKTTLLKGILGLIRPLSGHVEIFGQPLDKVKKRIGYVPQKSAVHWDFPTTALDVVLMGRYPHLGWVKRPGKEDREIARRALDTLGMSEFADRQISELSGGQKQRVFLARAIAQEADLYFLDEPFQGVDVKTEKIIVKQLDRLSEQGKTIVAVHHDLHTAPRYFDEVILLNKRLIAQGPVDDVLRDDILKKAYGTGFKDVL